MRGTQIRADQISSRIAADALTGSKNAPDSCTSLVSLDKDVLLYLALGDAGQAEGHFDELRERSGCVILRQANMPGFTLPRRAFWVQVASLTPRQLVVEVAELDMTKWFMVSELVNLSEARPRG